MVGGHVHLVASQLQRYNPGGSGRMPERGWGRATLAILMYGSVVTARVDTAGRGGRTAARSSLMVATSRAGGFGASVGGTSMGEGTEGADAV